MFSSIYTFKNNEDKYPDTPLNPPQIRPLKMRSIPHLPFFFFQPSPIYTQWSWNVCRIKSLKWCADPHISKLSPSHIPSSFASSLRTFSMHPLQFVCAHTQLSPIFCVGKHDMGREASLHDIFNHKKWTFFKHHVRKH